VPTRELAVVSRIPGGLEDLFTSSPGSRPPHYPFRSLADFEQTELFVGRDHTDGEIDDQLALWKRHAPGSGVSLKNAREMHQYLQAVGIEEDLSEVSNVVLGTLVIRRIIRLIFQLEVRTGRNTGPVRTQENS
jgi:hypothetical protein